MSDLNIKEFKLEDYKITTFDKVRYRDTDRQGHVNNAVFATFLETGRVEFLYNPENPLYDDGGSFVIAGVNTSLVGEIRWPGTVEIGTGIKKIGNSSVVIVQGLYQNDELKAFSETVIVQMDDITRKSKPLSERTKTELSKYLQK